MGQILGRSINAFSERYTVDVKQLQGLQQQDR